MDDKRELIGGKLVIFRRNGLWQARVPLHDGRYLWRSLKTAEEAAATQAATRLYYQTETKLAEGLPVHHRSFASVIDEYLRWREEDNRRGKQAKLGRNTKFTQDGMLRQVQRVSKFWREFAGSKSVEAIDDKALREFVEWRKAYYHNRENIPRNAKLNPTDKTLQWEIMLGKALVKFAHEKGYRGNKPLPEFTFVPKIKRVRPAFTIVEFKNLHRNLEVYLLEAKTDKQRTIRFLLHDYVMILALSGLRVGEANKLRVRDVVPIADSDGRPNVQFNVDGKTGARTVIPHIDVNRILESKRQREGVVDGDAYLFRMPSGSKIINRLVAKVCGLFRPPVRGTGPICRAFQNGMNPASMFTSPAMIDVLV